MAGEGQFIDKLMVGDVVAARNVSAPAGVVSKKDSLLYEILTAAKTLVAADNNKTFFLNSTTEFAVTLPTLELGLKFRFVVKAAPSGASYTIITPGSINKIYGAVASAEDAAGSVAVAQASDTITFVDGKAVIGDMVEVFSDGANWYVNGFCAVQDGITVAQAT